MSPANKFWLGVLTIFLIVILIKLPVLFFVIFIIYLIVTNVLYFIIISELNYVLEQQEKYVEHQKREKEERWFNNYYEDKTKEIEKYLFYLKFTINYWIVKTFKLFNNFLNNKFSKNGKI